MTDSEIQILYKEHLLPCPFCGTQPVPSHYQWSTHIKCKNCGISIGGHGPWTDRKWGIESGNFKHVQDLYDRWNTRNGVLIKLKLDSTYEYQLREKNHGNQKES